MKLAIDRINVRWKIFSAGVKVNVDDSMEEVKTDMKLLKQDSTRLFRVASERMGEMGDSMRTKVMMNSNHTKSDAAADATTGGGRGGAMGGTVPNLQHAALLYRTQLQSLREMGLLVVEQKNNNEQFCLELLQQQGGDLEQTVAVLLIKKVTK